MKNLVLGILAHVDAGKTTLAEAILYKSGVIKEAGRVDKGNSYLDTHEMEKQRGITIFSNHARFKWKDTDISIIDTPGHIDFLAETERTLQVLDYAVLVISGSEGVQGHTKTLWQLLDKYKIPVYIFINKTDMPDIDKKKITQDLKAEISGECVDFTDMDTESFYEEVSLADESMFDEYMNNGKININHIKKCIKDRKIFPCYFGSALKLQGIEEFLDIIEEYSIPNKYPQEFAAKVYKISRDENGNRLTHMKITGGKIYPKYNIECINEKVNEVRIYSGDKSVFMNEVKAGYICVVTGLVNTFAGQGLGLDRSVTESVSEPILEYKVVLPEGVDSAMAVPKLRMIEEEEPALCINWDKELQEIHMSIMGEVQLQVIKNIVSERFGMDIEFDHGKVVYMETIANVVEGVGHFEPLKHYAEVHLKLEPLEAGSGLEICTECSEDILSKVWQKIVLTHLKENSHKGVLTGSPVTDMRITLVNGKSHIKHTESEDFREAAERALRQGLKMAESVLLEPYYNFIIEVPGNMVGRAMTDIDRMHGKVDMPDTSGETAIITGYGPVKTLRDYNKEIITYTKGQGKMFCSLKGYYQCHNAEEIIAEAGYDSESDINYPTGSIFCKNGAGFYVNYDEVYNYMHLQNQNSSGGEISDANTSQDSIKVKTNEEIWLGTDEVEEIINRTYNANKKSDEFTKKNAWKKYRTKLPDSNYKSTDNFDKNKESYMLVDGYNVIFAWEDLKEIANDNMDGARGKLLDILSNYQAIKECNLMVIFDAYRIKGHNTEILKYDNIFVVFTKEAQTADQYIEKFAHENREKYNITVVTSDGLEQIIIRGEGCRLISSREFKGEVDRTVKEALENYYVRD